jgi:nicotinamidase-related amidase
MKYIHGPAMVMNHTDLIDLWAKSPRFDTAPSARAASATPPTTLSYEGRNIPNTEEEILNPKHTALVVHEMLNDFISDGGERPGGKIDASKIMKPIAELLAAARKKGVRVAYVRWTRHADGSTNSEPEIRNARGRPANPPYTIQGTWGWDAPDEIKPVAGEWVIPKWRTDAFFATPLDTLLHWNGIKTMVIVGIGAEAGVVPTLMHANNLGYFTVAVSDGIGPSNPARMEDAMRFINSLAIVKNHNEVIELWNRR